MNVLRNKSSRRLIIFVFIFIQASFLYLVKPKPTQMAALTSASTTLGNSRLSYKAGISGTESVGSTAIDIDASGNPDNDTDHLFINDDICFSNTVEGGCIGSTAYNVQAVDDITDGHLFNINPALANSLASTDIAIASQSGSMVIAFTTATSIPSTGDILVTIPAVDHATKPCDGMPDHASSVATNGFDLGNSNGTSAQRVGTADITVTGCTSGDWVTTETITCGTASTDHTIRIDRQNTTCTAGSAITITIDSTPGIINPAPITSGHTQGTADTYTVNVTTRDGSDVTLDTVDMKVAPIEAVQVSATVDETLSFIISGVASSTSACGQTTDVTTTSTQVPFGTLAAVNTFYEAANDLDVSTNADGGYAVTVSANDQLGRDGNTCTGDAGISSNCIPDTVCDGSSCTHLAAAVDDWETSTNNGFGYSLDSTAGTDATWEWDGTSGTCDGAGTDFCAAQFADEESSQTPVQIMSNANPVNSNNLYVCYRISVGGTQPAGTYYNRLRYTATAVF
jgi:hypothetical protein